MNCSRVTKTFVKCSKTIIAITTFANVPGSLLTIRINAKCFRLTVGHQDIYQMFQCHCLPYDDQLSVPWSLFAIWRFVERSSVTVSHL